MNLQRKTVYLLFCARSVLACSRETAGPEQDEKTLEIPVELEQPEGETRVDVNGATGRVTWTEGDTVGIYVEDSQGNSTGYREIAVVLNPESGYRKVTVPLNVYETLAGYAVYPYSAAYGDAAAPMVKYPVSYDMTGHDAEGVSSKTYVPVPMMAVNGEETLKFYHVGCIVRLNLSNVPATAATIEVTFVGMQHVTGVCRVLNPGTASATTEIFSGLGNKVTFTGFTPDADGNLSLNIPVPTGDYSGLTDIQIIASDASDTVVGQVAKNIHRPYPNDFNWGELKHAYGRLVPADFTAGGLLDHVTLDAGDATLWLNKTVLRVPTAYYDDGKKAGSISYSWASSDVSVASVNPASGEVLGVGPGEATVTVTATSPLDGRTATASYKVYVNEITAISLVAAASRIDKADDYTPAGTTTLTATVTHTNNGTVYSYPEDALIWTSSKPEYITLGGEVLGHPGAGSGDISAVATGNTLGGNSILTAQVNPMYTRSSSAVKATQTVYCRTKTRVVTPGTTVKGYTVSKGILIRSSTIYNLTDGQDPFEILRYVDEEAENGGNVTCRFEFRDLRTYFGCPDGVWTSVDHSLAKIEADGSQWIIPSADQWREIVATGEDVAGATVTNNQGLLGKRHFARVQIDFTGTPREGETRNQGIILFPDDAVITTDMSYFDVSTTNPVPYDDILTLFAGGCVVIPQWDGVKYYSTTVGAPYNVYGLAGAGISASGQLYGYVRMIKDN